MRLKKSRMKTRRRRTTTTRGEEKERTGQGKRTSQK